MYKHESFERKTQPKICEDCKSATLEPKQMNLFSVPNVFSFAIHWIQPDDVTREEIQRVFDFITPLIDIKRFMKMDTTDDKESAYVFRGFISYYGKHYMAYFYSEKYDYWMHLNDSKITEVGNFQDVIDKCKKGRELPILLFYESLQFLESILPETKKEKGYYRPKVFLKEKNRFWFKDVLFKKELKTRKKDKRDCTIF